MTDSEPIKRDLLLQDIRVYLPKPLRETQNLDGSLVLIGGDPGEVNVEVAENHVTVAVFAVVWEGPATPVDRPETIGQFNLKLLPAHQLLTSLHELIDSACAIRRSRYRKCEQCGETTPPEWMHDKKTCQRCATLRGVVY